MSHISLMSHRRIPVYESEMTKKRKFKVFEAQLMQLFQQCYSCGLEVKLETSIYGILLVVNGIYHHRT